MSTHTESVPGTRDKQRGLSSLASGDMREKRTGMRFLDLRQAANPAGAGGDSRSMEERRTPNPGVCNTAAAWRSLRFFVWARFGSVVRTGWVGEGDAKRSPRFDREDHHWSKPRLAHVRRLQRDGVACSFRAFHPPTWRRDKSRKKTSVCSWCRSEETRR